MVILKQNAVRQIIAVVMAAANLDSVLLKNAHIWCGFTRIQQLCLAALQHVGQTSGIGSDAAHTLEKIQSSPFAGEQTADIASDDANHRALRHPVPILIVKLKSSSIV